MTPLPFVTAVERLADKGEPMTVKQMLAYDPAEVRQALEAGRVERTTWRRGADAVAVIVPAAALEADESQWSDEEVAYLELAYTSGVSFSRMVEALGRSGGGILQKAWSLKMTRRPACDRWGAEVPAWRVHRLRALLDEARMRGGNADDDGAGLEHRALLRAFERGRADLVAARGDALRHGRPWHDAELERLVALRRDEGFTPRQCALVLHRSPAAVLSKLSELGVVFEKAWNADEDSLLLAGLARGLTARQCAAFLPGRSELACKQRGLKLWPGRGFAPWSEEERQALRQAVERGDNMVAFAASIGRGLSGVRWQCKELGLSHPDAPKHYAPHEDRRIIEGWRRLEAPRIIAEDLGRPLRSVYCRAHKLGVTGKGAGHYRGKRWRRFEIEYIRTRAGQGWKARRIAERLNRSQHMVYRQAALNGIVFANSARSRAKLEKES